MHCPINGDIIGSLYAFNNYRAKDFGPLFHPKSFVTDDTICTAARIAWLKLPKNVQAVLIDLYNKAKHRS